MSGHDLICPHENIVLGSVIKAKKQIINGSRLECVVNVVNSSFLIVSCDVACISFVIGKVLIEEFNSVVTVTTNKRIRDLAVHKRDRFLSGLPLSLRSCFFVVSMSYVYAVLGYITKSDNVLNILGWLIVQNPLVYILEKFRILICNRLCITDDRKTVGIVLIGKFYVFLFPKELLICRCISVTRYIFKISVCILRRDLIACE